MIQIELVQFPSDTEMIRHIIAKTLSDKIIKWYR